MPGLKRESQTAVDGDQPSKKFKDSKGFSKGAKGPSKDSGYVKKDLKKDFKKEFKKDFKKTDNKVAMGLNSSAGSTFIVVQLRPRKHTKTMNSSKLQRSTCTAARGRKRAKSSQTKCRQHSQNQEALGETSNQICRTKGGTSSASRGALRHHHRQCQGLCFQA